MKPGRKKKGAGRTHAAEPKTKPAADVDDREGNVMTIQDVADYLHCHYHTVYRLVKRGEIPCFRLGGNWRFLKSEVDKWIAAGGGRPSETAITKTDGRRRYQRKPK
jgi:excisionase family DNA binding protein